MGREKQMDRTELHWLHSRALAATPRPRDPVTQSRRATQQQPLRTVTDSPNSPGSLGSRSGSPHTVQSSKRIGPPFRVRSIDDNRVRARGAD